MKNYYLKVWLVALATTALSIFTYHCRSLMYDKYSFINALDYYGFDSFSQKQSIQNLLQRSSVIPINHKFPIRKTKEEVAPDVIDIVRGMQERFTIRSGTQERWDTKELGWMNENKDKSLLDLKELGFVDEIKPKEKSVDAFCILGAIAPTMATRIEYANALIDSGLKTKSIILLAGERYVTKGVDGTEDQLIKTANTLDLQDWTKLTETHLINELYTTSALYNKHISTYVIDTPKGDLPRPTTQTTILNLIEWLKSHNEIRNIIFISNQPYAKYQNAVIDLIFKEQQVNVKYEVVGASVKNTESLKPILEALGAYVWAKTPIALGDMGVIIKDESTKQSLHELYSKNPLIYKTIPQLLNR